MVRKHDKRQMGYKGFSAWKLIEHGLFRLNAVGVLLVLLTALPVTAQASAPSSPTTQFQVSVGDWYCGSFTTVHPTFGSALAALYAYTNGCSVAGPVTVDTCSGIEPSISTSGSCSFVRYKPSQGDSEGGSVSWSFSCSQAGTSYNPASGYCEAPDSWQAGKNDIAGCNDVGNPCNAGTGHKHQLEFDYQADGPGGLRFVRRYSSLHVGASGMGNGWRHNYAGRVIKDPAGRFVRVERPNGQTLIFRPNGTGGWTADGDINDRLQENIEWRYITADKEIEVYDTSGRLRSISDRNGVTQTLIYSDANTGNTIAPHPGLLIQVDDQFGRRLRLNYDINARIVMLIDANGAETRYGYDAAGRLASVSYPDDTPADTTDNPQKKYYYQDSRYPNALTGIDDEKGTRFAAWSYDAQGRVIFSSHAGDAEKVTLDYNENDSTTVSHYQSSPDTASISRVYGFQSILGVVKNTGISQPDFQGGTSTSAFAYDANGNLASRTDFNGNLSCYAYDLSRNLEIVRLEGLAAGTGCPADLAAFKPAANSIERKTTTQWHAKYRQPIQIDETGRRISFSYDANGNLLQTSVTDTTTNQSRTWAYTYNDIGQVLTEDGPRTDVDDITRYSYYGDSTADHKPGDLWKVSNALGHVITLTAYDANGRLLSLTDPNGLVIGFVYDARGRLTQKTVDGNTTRYDYDPAGNLAKVTHPTGVFIVYTYDAAHRLTDITDALGGKIHYTLDLMGNRIKEEILAADGTLVKTSSHVFDALSRLQQDIGAYNQTTTYRYDANDNLTQITDANGHAAQHAYDSLNRLIRVTDALAGLTDFQYDAQDRITQVSDAKYHSTVYRYNGLGDLTKLDSPNTGITQYSYDSAGNLAQKTDAGNVTASYRYDALNRLLGADYPGTEADTSYLYDTTRDRQAGQTGRLTESRRGDIVALHYHDLRGNQTANIVKNNANVQILSDTHYEYDAGDRLNQIRLSPTTRIQYYYDIADQIQRIDLVDTNGTTPLADTIRHLPFGPVQRLHYGNGADLLRTYDQDYRLIQESAGTIHNLSYDYKADGQLTELIDTIGGRRQTFDYDPMHRLSTVTVDPQTGQNQEYIYDLVGNRTEQHTNKTSTRYDYALDSQRLLTVSNGHHKPTGYISNPQGNINQIGTLALNYSADQRLSNIAQTKNKKHISELARYQYDAQGRRVAKITTKGTTYYGYDLDQHLLSEDAGDRSYYVYLEGQPLARIDGSGDTAKPNYFHNNHLGTPLKVSDQAGQVIWTAELDPFGHATTTNPDIVQNLRFPGQYYDQETGWHYNMQRYYDPALGRYLQSDPIGLEGGVNAYAYALNNPANLTDPTGNCPWCIPLAIMALEAWNAYDTVNDVIETANVLADNCSSNNDKFGAIGLFALGVVDPTPGNLAKKAAKGARDAAVELTTVGERFVRVGAGPENLKFTFKTSGGVQTGTYAFPEKTFLEIGRNPTALKNFGDLPGAPPQYFRILEPPAGTPIQRGLVPGGEFGGVGGVPEVLFPEGF